MSEQILTKQQEEISNTTMTCVFDSERKLKFKLPLNEISRILKVPRYFIINILNSRNRCLRDAYYLFTETEVTNGDHVQGMWRNSHQFKMYLFGLEGNQISTFRSMSEMAISLSAQASSIQSVIDRHNRLYKRKYFIFTEAEVISGMAAKRIADLKLAKEIKLEKTAALKNREKKDTGRGKYALIAFTYETFSYRHFESLTEAASFVGCTKGQISKVIGKPTANLRGFNFIRDYENSLDKIKQAFVIKKKQNALARMDIELTQKREMQKELALDFLAIFQDK